MSSKVPIRIFGCGDGRRRFKGMCAWSCSRAFEVFAWAERGTGMHRADIASWGAVAFICISACFIVI